MRDCLARPVAPDSQPLWGRFSTRTDGQRKVETDDRMAVAIATLKSSSIALGPRAVLSSYYIIHRLAPATGEAASYCTSGRMYCQVTWQTICHACQNSVTWLSPAT